MKIRELYLSPKFPNYQLAHHILDKEMSTRDEPAVVECLRDAIPTIEALRHVLFSDQLYQNQQFFDRWCKALESGVLRGTYQTTPQPIESSLTAWHEAHFRLVPFSLYIISRLHNKALLFFALFYSLELWYTLSPTFSRHSSNPNHMAERAANYKRMYKYVRTERDSNANDAWNLRRAQLNIEDRDVRDHNIGKHGGINFDDLESF